MTMMRWHRPHFGWRLLQFCSCFCFSSTLHPVATITVMVWGARTHIYWYICETIVCVKILTSATIVFIDIDYSVCQIMEMSSVKETCQSNQQKVERAAEQKTIIVASLEISQSICLQPKGLFLEMRSPKQVDSWTLGPPKKNDGKLISHCDMSFPSFW